MSRIIGIDLGSTHSVMAVVQDGRAAIIPNRRGERLTPSAVLFREDGTTAVGHEALRARVSNPRHTIVGIKRFMGRRYDEVLDLLLSVPFSVVPDDEGWAVIEIDGRTWSPAQISALILVELRDAAKDALGDAWSGDVVVTVPAHFGFRECSATRHAVQLAGLRLKRLVIEPAAAAMALPTPLRRDVYAAVFDLGGGTFDITLVTMSEDVVEVEATGGDALLGGDDFDARLTDWLIDEIELAASTGGPLSAEARERVSAAAHEARHRLSSALLAPITLPFITRTNNGWLDYVFDLTRELFAEICAELLARLRAACEATLQDPPWGRSKVDRLIVVGGGGRMPVVVKTAEEVFGRAADHHLNPDEAIAIGAAVQAGVVSGANKDILLLPVTSHALSIRLADGSSEVFIPRNTTIPTKRVRRFGPCHPGQTSVMVTLLEGDHPVSARNRVLTQVVMQELPSTHCWHVEVTVDVDVNGTVELSLKEQTTGRAGPRAYVSALG